MSGGDSHENVSACIGPTNDDMERMAITTLRHIELDGSLTHFRHTNDNGGDGAIRRALTGNMGFTKWTCEHCTLCTSTRRLDPREGRRCRLRENEDVAFGVDQPSAHRNRIEAMLYNWCRHPHAQAKDVPSQGLIVFGQITWGALTLLYKTIRDGASELWRSILFAQIMPKFNRGGAYIDLAVEDSHSFGRTPTETTSMLYPEDVIGARIAYWIDDSTAVAHKRNTCGHQVGISKLKNALRMMKKQLPAHDFVSKAVEKIKTEYAKQNIQTVEQVLKTIHNDLALAMKILQDQRIRLDASHGGSAFRGSFDAQLEFELLDLADKTKPKTVTKKQKQVFTTWLKTREQERQKRQKRQQQRQQPGTGSWWYPSVPVQDPRQHYDDNDDDDDDDDDEVNSPGVNKLDARADETSM